MLRNDSPLDCILLMTLPPEVIYCIAILSIMESSTFYNEFASSQLRLPPFAQTCSFFYKQFAFDRNTKELTAAIYNDDEEKILEYAENQPQTFFMHFLGSCTPISPPKYTPFQQILLQGNIWLLEKIMPHLDSMLAEKHNAQIALNQINFILSPKTPRSIVKSDFDTIANEIIDDSELTRGTDFYTTYTANCLAALQQKIELNFKTNPAKGFVNNLTLLQLAYETYEHNFDAFHEGLKSNIKAPVYCIQVIGYLQRSLPTYFLKFLCPSEKINKQFRERLGEEIFIQWNREVTNYNYEQEWVAEKYQKMQMEVKNYFAKLTSGLIEKMKRSALTP